MTDCALHNRIVRCTDLRKSHREIIDDMLAWFKQIGIVKVTRRDTEVAWETMFKAHYSALRRFDQFFTSISRDAYDQAKKMPVVESLALGCKYCSSSFKSQGGLTNHVQLKHVQEALAEAEASITKSFTEQRRYDEISLQHHIASVVAAQRTRLYMLHGRFSETIDCLKTQITEYLAAITHELDVSLAKANPSEKSSLTRQHKRDVRDFVKHCIDDYKSVIEGRLKGQAIPPEITKGLKNLKVLFEDGT